MSTSYRFAAALAFLCLLALGPPAGADEDVRINLELEKADVREAIVLIARAANANVILAPDVQGEVTVSLRDVPWRAALEQLAAIVGATIVEEGSGIVRVRARAEPPAASLRYYDVKDLAGVRDYMFELLLKAAPGATIEERNYVLVVRARPRQHELIDFVLRGLRARAGLAQPDPGPAPPAPPPPPPAIPAPPPAPPPPPEPPAPPKDPAKAADRLVVVDIQQRCEETKITLDLQEASGEAFREALADQLNVAVGATPLAKKRLAELKISVSFREEPARSVLDALATFSKLAWSEVHGGLLFHGPDESPDGWFVLRGTTKVRHPLRIEWHKSPTVFPWGEDWRPVTTPAAADLEARIQALHEEVRALRAEVKEIKEILLEERERGR